MTIINYASGNRGGKMGISVVRHNNMDCVLFKGPNLLSSPIYITVDEFLNAAEEVRLTSRPNEEVHGTVEVSEEWIQHVEDKLKALALAQSEQVRSTDYLIKDIQRAYSQAVKAFDKAEAAHAKADYNNQRITVIQEERINYALADDVQTWDSFEGDINEFRDRITAIERQLRTDEEAKSAETMGLGFIMRDIGTLADLINKNKDTLIAHKHLIGAIIQELKDEEDKDTNV